MPTETTTFCGICGAHCSAKVTVEKGKIVKWEQDKESGFTYLPCPSFKGRASAEIAEHPDRLKYPLKRTGARGEGKWQRISWDEALDTIASKLTELKEKYGPECLAAGVGEPKAMEFVWLERFCSAFGTPNIATPHGLCGANAMSALSATFGPKHNVGGYEPVKGAEPPKLMIVWGCAVGELTAEPREMVKDLISNGVKLVVIDPRRIRITKWADLWIKPRPGSDAALAMGLLKVIIEEELYDKEFVANWTVGFDRLREHVKTFTLEDVERVTWVPRQQFQQVARWYARYKPAILKADMNTWSQGARNFQAMRIIYILRSIVSRLNIPGWGISYTRPGYRPAGQMYLLDKLPRKVEGNVASKYKYALRSAYIPDQALVNGILDGRIKAAIFTQCDPLITYPNARKVYDAFMKLDLLVSANIFMVPTAAVADIVLPVATSNECDTMTCGTGAGILRAIPKIIDPPGEALSDVMILNKLAKRLGLGEYFFDSDVESINYVLGPSGLIWEDMKKKRILEGKREKKAEEGGFFTTASGRAEIYSERARDVFGESPMPLWEEVLPLEEPSAEFPLLVTSYCDEEFRLSAFKHVKYMRKRKTYPTVQLNTETARSIGARDGDWVWIETKIGRIMQKLVIDPELDPRVVMASFGWYFPEDPSNANQWDKSNINILFPDEPDEAATGSVSLRGFPCRVYKAEQTEVGLPAYA